MQGPTGKRAKKGGGPGNLARWLQRVIKRSPSGIGARRLASIRGIGEAWVKGVNVSARGATFWREGRHQSTRNQHRCSRVDSDHPVVLRRLIENHRQSGGEDLRSSRDFVDGEDIIPDLVKNLTGRHPPRRRELSQSRNNPSAGETPRLVGDGGTSAEKAGLCVESIYPVGPRGAQGSHRSKQKGGRTVGAPIVGRKGHPGEKKVKASRLGRNATAAGGA